MRISQFCRVTTQAETFPQALTVLSNTSVPKSLVAGGGEIPAFGLSSLEGSRPNTKDTNSRLIEFEGKPPPKRKEKGKGPQRSRLSPPPKLPASRGLRRVAGCEPPAWIETKGRGGGWGAAHRVGRQAIRKGPTKQTGSRLVAPVCLFGFAKGS